MLRLLAGQRRRTGPDRLEIIGTPDAGGGLFLLDGSSLLFNQPITIRWAPAPDAVG